MCLSAPAARAGRASSPASPKAGRPSARASHAAATRKGGASPARGQASPSYNAPSLWTKGAPSKPPAGGPVRRALGFTGRALLSVLALAGRGASWAARSLGSLVRRSRVALAVTVLAAALVAGGAVDFGLNWGKAYAGVSIGEVDVSGKDAEEMRALVEQAYAARLAAGSATVFASDDAAARVADAAAQAEDEALAEQRSVEEARAAKQLWTADATALGAVLPAEQLVEEALAVGREEGGLGARLAALFGGWTVEVRADYDAGALEELVQMSRIKQIYLPENAEHGADDEMLEVLSRLKQSGVGFVYLRAGDEISTRGDLKLSVLHPDAARDFDNANDYSLVIRAEYAGRTILITGDLTEAGEDFDVSECDVLKVAHHGSAGSSSLDFLCAANPKLALISVAAHNSYGLPKQALLDRLNYIAAQVLTTAEGGDITVHISPDGEITASTYLNTQS